MGVRGSGEAISKPVLLTTRALLGDSQAGAGVLP